jgi:hypothetical protein
MRRARAVFAAQHVDTVPVPCDFRTGQSRGLVSAILPSAAAFATSTTMFREWLGILSYRLRGRL